MIAEFTLETFRSYRQATLPLSTLTLLIGANASGKSNALEGLRMLSGLAKGQYLSDVFQTLRKDGSIRGTMDDLTYGTHETFALGCVTNRVPDWRNLVVKVRHDEKELLIEKETIDRPGSTFPLYRVAQPAGRYGHELRVAYNNFARGGIKPQITCDNRQAVFTQLTTPARFSTPQAQRKLPEVTQAFRQMLENILFLDPAPRRMRDYSFVTDNELQGDGANLSSVLFWLCERQDQKAQVLAFIRALPEQDIRDVGFVETPRNEVMVRLTESFGGQTREWDAAILSDGTLRVLAVAAAVLSATRGSLVVIEEIDNGVHPSRAHTLLENIQKAAQERNLHVLLTTHNPALLDALPIKAIPNVVACYRDPVKGDSRLVRLESLPDYPKLMAQGSVGSLMTRGILEKYLKRLPESREEKIAKALSWLESLKQEEVEP